MAGVRGLDENIKFARLHLDSRFCATTMSAADDCRLLGRVYHINHSKSLINRPKTAGMQYRWDASLPYLNPSNWGLADFEWRQTGERLYTVSLPKAEAVSLIPDNLTARAREQASITRARLCAVRELVQPDEPAVLTELIPGVVDLWRVGTSPDWDSTLNKTAEGLRIESGAAQWALAAVFPLAEGAPLSPDYWHWVRLSMTVDEGAIGISADNGPSTGVGAGWVTTARRSTDVFVKLPVGARHVLLQNVGDLGRSLATVHAIEIVGHRATGNA